MGGCSVASLLALFELVISFAALIMKKLTDSQGEQVNKRNQKLSTEWNLLNNLNWTQAGNDFSLITYGGYTLIAGAFFLSRLQTNKFRYGLCERILLSCGIIFFLTEACLVFGAWEYIPKELQINAIVLGSLSAAGAILFFIDLCYSSSTEKSLSKEVQTEMEYFITKQLPIIPTKASIQPKSSIPANIQSYTTNGHPKLHKFKTKCCDMKNSTSKYLKTRVLQTDV